jgi:hypothetical protein
MSGIKQLSEMTDEELIELHQQISGRVGAYHTEVLIARMFEIRSVLKDRFEMIRAELAAARKALEFYASVENYNLESTTFGVFDDRGAQARAVLGAAKEDKV